MSLTKAFGETVPNDTSEKNGRKLRSNLHSLMTYTSKISVEKSYISEGRKYTKKSKPNEKN